MNSPLYALRVDGVPQPQGRPRFSIVGYGYTNRVKARDPERSVAWKGVIARSALGNRPVPILTCPLRAQLRFELPQPRRARDISPHVGVKDLDNLVKAVMDGLQGVVYRNDCQIVELEASKVYGPTPGVWIWLHQVQR